MAKLSIGLVLLVASLARAETNPLSLADAKRLAFERNWDLLAAKSDVDRALAQKIIAHEWPNPTFSFSTSKINVDNHSNATSLGNDVWDRSYDTIFAINQLYELGKRGPRQASAQAGSEAARARLADAKRTLDAAVTKAYVAAALAAANAKVLLESTGYLRKEADIAAIRFKAGDISRSDLDQIEIAAAQDELNAKTAEAAAVQQRIAVEVLLGEKKPTGHWSAADRLEDLAGLPASPPGPNGAERPDLIAAHAALREADADLKLQKAQRIPDPTFSLQYEHNPPDGPNTVGFGVTFPLPLWNQNGGAIRAAEVTRDQAARTVEQTRAQIASDIASARSAYGEALARWQHYRDVVQPKSAKVRETVSFSYEKGSATLVDLLEAQRNDNTVRLATAQAAADTATAAARWQRRSTTVFKKIKSGVNHETKSDSHQHSPRCWLVVTRRRNRLPKHRERKSPARKSRSRTKRPSSSISSPPPSNHGSHPRPVCLGGWLGMMMSPCASLRRSAVVC